MAVLTRAYLKDLIVENVSDFENLQAELGLNWVLLMGERAIRQHSRYFGRRARGTVEDGILDYALVLLFLGEKSFEFAASSGCLQIQRMESEEKANLLGAMATQLRGYFSEHPKWFYN